MNPHNSDPTGCKPTTGAYICVPYDISAGLLKASARFCSQEAYYTPAILKSLDALALYHSMRDRGIPLRTDDAAVLLLATHACSYLLRHTLAAGANPNATDAAGRSALEHALAHPRHPQGCAARLIRHGAAFPPGLLIDAVRSSRRELVDALLQAGADTNTTDTRGCTALHYAARMGKAYFVRALVAHGADTAARTHANYTPLLLAIRHRRFAAATALLELGADTHATGGKHNEAAAATARRYQCRIDGTRLINAPLPHTLKTHAYKTMLNNHPGNTDAPQEIVQLLAERQSMRVRFMPAIQDGDLRGGPGYTQKTAWVITREDMSAIDLQYTTLRFLFTELTLYLNGTITPVEVEHIRQKLSHKDGKSYDTHELNLQINGEHYKVEQWFDITLYYNTLQGSTWDDPEADLH